MENNFNAEQEQRFRNWLKKQYTAEGMRIYSDNAIMAYAYALRTVLKGVDPNFDGNLFCFHKLYSFQSALKTLMDDPDYTEALKADRQTTFPVAVKLYEYFLEHGEYSTAPVISAEFYKSETNSNGETTSITKLTGDAKDAAEDYTYHEIPMVPLQKIFYGAPGTGKSYHVNQLLAEYYPDPEERAMHTARLIFHPSYTYQDLVGSIKPLMTVDRPLDYLFAAGPITALLKDAFLYPDETYYLVIEEINRGNAPAIFGDLFQLLDRTETGRSRYSISNHDMASFFARDPALKKLFTDEKVWFPPNFNILATMNTADENIFVLDNAFKRRFSLEYAKISFDNLPEQWCENYGTFAGNKSLLTLFQGTALEEYTNQLYYERKLSRDWPTFARLVNKIIDIENRKLLSAGTSLSQLEQIALARIPENKKLGPFFVAESDLCQRDTFVNKVVFYLKQDIFPNHSHYLRESYEELYMRYLEDEADLFELLR